jgi:hypothetical protein
MIHIALEGGKKVDVAKEVFSKHQDIIIKDTKKKDFLNHLLMMEGFNESETFLTLEPILIDEKCHTFENFSVI